MTQFMERSPLARQVAGLVLDAPALDWKAILSFNASEMGLPSFAADPVEWMIGARIDADWSGLDALRHIGDFHLPILLFHGTDDETVPIATSNEFAKKLPGWVTYYRVPHAGHVEFWNVDPGLYEERLTAFLPRLTDSPGRGSYHASRALAPPVPAAPNASPTQGQKAEQKAEQTIRTVVLHTHPNLN